MKLIITEKPSVAKNIADALKIKTRRDGYYEGNNFIITWAFGHLLQLYDAKDYDSKMKRWHMDHFPFIPETFLYKVKTSNSNRNKEDLGAKKQLKIIYSLMKRQDVECIISACDYDREGQIIGDIIIGKSNIKKDVYRLLLNEWTQDEVVRGLKALKSNRVMISLRDAGISRQWADWVIGINLTSVATLKYQKGSGYALNIGRVLLPTLKIIYDRDQEIENFTPEQYFKLNATFQTVDQKQYEGTYMENENNKFKDRDVLQQVKQQVVGKSGEITNKQVEKKKEYPPMLFNLSNLQGYISSKYKGWTSDKVLRVAQTLYEKKFITYPRTSSVALDESLVSKTSKVLQAIKKGLPYEEEITFHTSKRIFNSKKIESHSAIVPTYVLPKTLSSEEQIVYNAIKNRFLMQFMPLAEIEETKIITEVKDANIKGVFVSKGKVQLVEGWKKVETIESKDVLLPIVNKNDVVNVVKQTLSSHVTKPPKHHTEKTLLRVMETCGKGIDEEESAEMMEAIMSGFSIGTPATRAETIKKLKDVGYITTNQKYLTCTELGNNLVTTFPIKQLFDLDFTGRLEKTLLDIEKQKVSRDQFLNMIFAFTRESVETIKREEEKIINEVVKTKKQLEILGACPVCGKAIIEGKKGFGCSNWKNGCKFVIWKNDKFLAAMKKKPTKTMVKTLLKQKSVTVKGLTSKKGNTFDAILTYEKNESNEYFSWKMSFLSKKGTSNY